MLDIESRLSAALLAFYGPPGTGCPDIPLEETARRVVEARFGVEIFIGETWENRVLPSDETVARIAEACRSARIVTTHAQFHEWDPEKLRNEILISAAMGASVMVVHPGNLGHDVKSCVSDAQAVRDVCLFALDHGVLLALENLVATGIDSMRRSLDMIGNEPLKTGLGICIDIGHANREQTLDGVTPCDYLAEFRDAIVEVHIYDNTGEKDHHLPPGTCTIDWPPVVCAMRQLPEDAVLCLEMIARDRPLRAMQEARAFLISCGKGAAD